MASAQDVGRRSEQCRQRSGGGAEQRARGDAARAIERRPAVRTAVSATVASTLRRAGLPAVAPSSIRLVWPTSAAAMTSDQQQRGRGRPAQAGGEPGRTMPSSLANRLNGGSPISASDAEAEAPGQHRLAGGQAAHPVDPAGPGELQEPAGAEEQHALGQPVAEDVQQHRGDGQRAADRRAPSASRPMCSMLE